MTNHIVSFRLKGTPEQRLDAAKRFKEALLALPQEIDVLKSMKVGINSNPDEDWDIVLIAQVPEMKDVKTYATHPAHIKAAAIIAPLKDCRACVDFED